MKKALSMDSESQSRHNWAPAAYRGARIIIYWKRYYPRARNLTMRIKQDTKILAIETSCDPASFFRSRGLCPRIMESLR